MKVLKTLPAITIDMGGFPVKQAFPTQKVPNLDPFLLLHHAHTKYSNRRPARSQGVGPHPHRGFSPVTFVIEGEVHHRDSFGNNQIAKEGEVQWIHAGAGIVHSERPSQALVEGKRKQEIIQLWINTPAAKKMIPPSYHYVPETQMTVFPSEDGKIENKLIAGTYKKHQGKIEGQSELLMLWGKGQTGGEQVLTVPNAYQSMLYAIHGNIRIKGHGVIDKEHLIVLEPKGGHVEMEFTGPGQFLLLSGKPIEEKIEQYGPYVMNSQTELLEAMRDYQMGKMGILIEEDL